MGGKVDESGDEDDDDAADKMKKLDLEVTLNCFTAKLAGVQVPDFFSRQKQLADWSEKSAQEFTLHQLWPI